MSGNSNVGNAGVYEAGDQRTVKDSVLEEQKKENRFHEGKENSHLANDSSTCIPLPISPYPVPTHCTTSSTTAIISSKSIVVVEHS